jgi:predicted ABC-type ATPase
MVHLYQNALKQLDFTWHSHYPDDRIGQVHMPIITHLFRDAVMSATPKLILMAGAHGVGKGHVMRDLVSGSSGSACKVTVIDMDEIKTLLPENERLTKESPQEAGLIMHAEAAYLCDVAMYMALELGITLVLQGTLKYADYYKSVCDQVYKNYPLFQIEIIHVMARLDTILARAEHREKQTGRHVPESIIRDAYVTVPSSVEQLIPKVKMVTTIWNDRRM